MKRLVVIVVVAILLVVALPVVNLVIGVPSNRLSALQFEDPLTANAASVLSRKCASCHTAEPELPFYAKLPVASGLIQQDIQDGLAHLDIGQALIVPAGTPVPEVPLAKIEHALETDSMPPLRYQLLHWDSGLGDEDAAAISSWVKQVRKKHYATETVAPAFKHEVVQPLPDSLPLDAGKVALGEKLYHDTRLSGDGTVSCATCHALDKGGTDQLQFSKGIDGKVGDINAPTTLNSAFQFRQFWDGRAATLEEQAAGPVTNPIEMGAAWPDVVAKLEKDAAFRQTFVAVYPGGITRENIVNAIAEYERSLLTPDSRFDRYLKGDANALTAEEKDGYRLFKASGCATCHVGKLLGGKSYEKMGLKDDYFEARGSVSKPDFGRFNATGREADRFRFKVPTLRNLTETAPYFHDGSTTDLREAVRTMAVHQLGCALTDGKRERIVQFLKTLTGKLAAKTPK